MPGSRHSAECHSRSALLWSQVLLVLAISSAGCSPPDEIRAAKAGTHFLAERGIAFPEGVAKRWRPCTKGSVTGQITGYWTPPAGLIRIIDERLPVKLDSALRSIPAGEGKRRASDYHRQYLGLEVDGRRVVYVNGFHHSHVEAMVRSFENIAAVDSSFHNPGHQFWKQSPVSGCDGGWWYWGIVYDPMHNEFGPIRFESSS
jgi:hypothetical protein